MPRRRVVRKRSSQKVRKGISLPSKPGPSTSKTTTKVDLRKLKPISLKEHEKWFKSRFGSKNGEKFQRIASSAAFAYDFASHESDAFPYYVYVAEEYGLDISKITPTKTQSCLILNLQTEFDPKTKKVKTLSMPELQKKYKKYYRDSYFAMQAQAALTRSYLRKLFPSGKVTLYRATRDTPLKIPGLEWELAQKDSDRAILSGTLSRKVAEDFAKQERKKGGKSRVIKVTVPIEDIIDCYLTNSGFVHKEYEFRYVNRKALKKFRRK